MCIYNCVSINLNWVNNNIWGGIINMRSTEIESFRNSEIRSVMSTDQVPFIAHDDSKFPYSIADYSCGKRAHGKFRIPTYMSTQREVFEGQTTARRVKRGGLWKGGRGGGGLSPGNFQKPVLQMVQSELFLSYICQFK